MCEMIRLQEKSTQATATHVHTTEQKIYVPTTIYTPMASIGWMHSSAVSTPSMPTSRRAGVAPGGQVPARPGIALRPPTARHENREPGLFDDDDFTPRAPSRRPEPQPRFTPCPQTEEHRLPMQEPVASVYVARRPMCVYSEELVELANEFGILLDIHDVQVEEPPHWLTGIPTLVHEGRAYCGDATFQFIRDYASAQATAAHEAAMRREEYERSQRQQPRREDEYNQPPRQSAAIGQRVQEPRDPDAEAYNFLAVPSEADATPPAAIGGSILNYEEDQGKLLADMADRAAASEAPLDKNSLEQLMNERTSVPGPPPRH